MEYQTIGGSERLLRLEAEFREHLRHQFLGREPRRVQPQPRWRPNRAPAKKHQAGPFCDRVMVYSSRARKGYHGQRIELGSRHSSLVVLDDPFDEFATAANCAAAAEDRLRVCGGRSVHRSRCMWRWRVCCSALRRGGRRFGRAHFQTWWRCPSRSKKSLGSLLSPCCRRKGMLHLPISSRAERTCFCVETRHSG